MYINQEQCKNGNCVNKNIKNNKIASIKINKFIQNVKLNIIKIQSKVQIIIIIKGNIVLYY